jgi:hypothetical protein
VSDYRRAYTVVDDGASKAFTVANLVRTAEDYSGRLCLLQRIELASPAQCRARPPTLSVFALECRDEETAGGRSLENEQEIAY